MKHTLKAILARFDGNQEAADEYCRLIAETASNPYLRAEYSIIRVAIRLKWKELAAHV
jgi:hypothetical protein